jgi:hypothetical protein
MAHEAQHWTDRIGGDDGLGGRGPAGETGARQPGVDRRLVERHIPWPLGFEFLRIEQKGDEIVYLSMPNGRSPATPFPLKEVSGTRVVFENPTHDFPQRIIYWKDGADLRARIEGTQNGKEGSMEWRWSPATPKP